MARFSMQQTSPSRISGHSAPVTSNQTGLHPDLERVVLRHRRTRFKRAIAAHSMRAFRSIDHDVHSSDLRVIIDSGCGGGESTRALAAQYPHALVIGVDKSAVRLAHAKALATAAPLSNLRFVRAELGDFWRLAADHRWPVEAHYLLYPNPWPKKKHLMRRWHGHPALMDLIRLGGRLEVRSNWRTYAEEFVVALKLLGFAGAELMAWRPERVVSPFERKYLASTHRLFRVTADLDVRA